MNSPKKGMNNLIAMFSVTRELMCRCVFRVGLSDILNIQASPMSFTHSCTASSVLPCHKVA